MFFPIISLVWEGFGAQIAWGTSSETFQNQGNERKIHVLNMLYRVLKNYSSIITNFGAYARGALADRLVL